MRVNVFELIGSFEQGGSELQALQLSRRLRNENSFDVYLGCLNRSGELLSRVDWIAKETIPEYKLTSFYNVNFIRQARRCASFLKAKKIHVVHTHDFYTNIFGMLAAWMARVPVRIASKRETFSKTDRQTQLERQAYRLADRIVVNAEAVKDFLIERGVPRTKPVIIYNGVDTASYDLRDSRLQLVTNLGLSHVAEKKLVVLVANLRSDVKNHSMFLRAARAVSDRIAGSAFIIAGEGDLTNSIRDESVRLGVGNRVHFIGACSDVPALLNVADVCALSSRSEGFSNAILEYMASGKPAVATRVGGAAEAIVEGETGYLVDSDDDQAMAARITEILERPNLAKLLGDNGRKRVQERFSCESQLRRTIELYESCLKSKTSTSVLRNPLEAV